MNKHSNRKSKINQVQQIQQAVKLIKQNGKGRSTKYFSLKKNEQDLDKPKYVGFDQQHLKEKNKMPSQFHLQTYDYTNQKLCDNPQINPKPTNIPVKYQSFSLVSPLPKLKQQLNLDATQMNSFLQQFQQEEQQRKKSKYETIINRLKSKQFEQSKSKDDLNIVDILRIMTPSYEVYQKQKSSLIEQDNHQHIIEDFDQNQKKIIPKTIKKLGLLSTEQRKEEIIQRLQSKAQKMIQSDSRMKTIDELKGDINMSISPFSQEHKRIRTDTSNIAFEYQQKQIDNYLQIQESQGKYFNPFQIKKLIKTKKKVKQFYYSILEFQKINKLDYEEKSNDVKQIMGGIKSTLNDRYGELMTQSEKMELNMVNEIKQESALQHKK